VTRIYTLVNQKGGVGKTTTTINLGAYLAQLGQRVLVVDLDPQANATSCLGVDKLGVQGGTYEALLGDKQVASYVLLNERLNLSLLPSSPSLAGAEVELVDELAREVRLRKAIAPLADKYDYVLIDIGRSLSRITLPLIQHADLNILVVSTDVSTVSLTKPILGYMKSKGVNMDSVFALLNRAVGLEGLSKAETEIALEIPIRTTMPYLSSNMAFANHHHQPFTLKFPRDTASIVFQEAAKEMSILARNLRAE